MISYTTQIFLTRAEYHLTCPHFLTHIHYNSAEKETEKIETLFLYPVKEQ